LIDQVTDVIQTRTRPRQDGETASKALGIESDYPAAAPGAVRQKRKYTRRKGGEAGE
jgi:hypothetical protein